jgi:hypothetical protein
MSRRFYIVLGLAVLAFVAVGWLGVRSRMVRTYSEQTIRSELIQANHCTYTSDCVSVEAKCPFGCAIFVYKDEADKIQSLLNNFESTCIYECVRVRGVACISGVCEAVY